MQVVDDFSRMGFSYFIKTKDAIGGGFKQLLNRFNLLNNKVEFIRCDNSGENERYVAELASKFKIQMEYTSTDTPQYNGVVERQIETLKQRAIAMMNAAGLNKSAQNFLWTEAIRCANTLYNISCNSVRENPPYKIFMKRDVKIYPHLIEFGRKGVITTGKKKALSNRGTRIIMVGYASNKSRHTYQVYNPTTRKVTERRDVVWMNWEKTIPKQWIDIFQSTKEHPEDQELRLNLDPDPILGRTRQATA